MKFQKGQSLFELVLAIAMSALIITAIVYLATNSIQNSSYSRDKTLASNYIQELNEWLRQQRDEYADFNIKTDTATWCFTITAWNNPGLCDWDNSSDYLNTKFLRQTTFSKSIVNQKEMLNIYTTVSWRDSKGTHQASSSGILSIK